MDKERKEQHMVQISRKDGHLVQISRIDGRLIQISRIDGHRNSVGIRGVRERSGRAEIMFLESWSSSRSMDKESNS